MQVLRWRHNIIDDHDRMFEVKREVLCRSWRLQFTAEEWFSFGHVFALYFNDMIKILQEPYNSLPSILWNTVPYQMLVFKLSEWFCTRPQIIFNILEPNLTIISLNYEILCTTNSCLFGFVATRILFDSLSAVEHIVFWNIGVFLMFHNIERWAFKNISQFLQERHRCQLMFATLAMSEWTFWPKEADALISWHLSLGVILTLEITSYII